jgi:Sec-independent protein translocase protein TatA
MMMMGIGLLFILVIGLVVIGVPVLIAALIAGGGGLATLFKPKTRQAEPDHSSSPHEPPVDKKCPACGRTVRPDWNVCPSCGAALM